MTTASIEPKQALEPSQVEVESQHEHMTSERLGELISAIGNHEGKALLMLAMQPGAIYKQSELHHLVTDLPGASDAYVGSHRNQIDYCKKSIEPIGMVAKADFGDVLRFGITESGEEVGKPLAAFLLEIGEQYGVSLESMFGATRGKNNEGPFVRYLVVEELLTVSDGLNMSKFANEFGFSRDVMSEHLRKMHIEGLISFRPWIDGEDNIIYSSGAAKYDLKQPGNKPSEVLLSAVNYVNSKGEATFDEIVDHCLGGRELEESELRQFRHNLATALKGSSDKGALVRKEYNRVGADNIAFMNKEQTKFWMEVITGLEKIKELNPEFLKKYREKGVEILSKPKKVKSALNRAAQRSPFLQNGDEKDTGILIMRAIGQGELSVRQLCELVSEMDGGRAFAVDSVRRVVCELRDEGKLDEIQSNPLRYKQPRDYLQATSTD